MKGQLQRLVNLPAQRDLLLLLRPFQPERRPINCMRFRQPPFQRAIFIVHLLHVDGVEFIFFTEDSGALLFIVGLGMDQCLVIRAVQHLVHFARPPGFEVHVGVVQVLTDLVLKNPA